MKRKKTVVRFKTVTKRVKVKRTIWLVEPCYVKIGLRIAEIRKQRGGVRQEDLAKAIKVSRATLANMEAGRQRIMLHHVLAISKVLGSAVENFLKDIL